MAIDATYRPVFQAHPAPGSLAELEASYAWLQAEREQDAGEPSSWDLALDVALRALYQEICRRSVAVTQADGVRRAALARLGLPYRLPLDPWTATDAQRLTEAELRALDGNR